eukprot:SAG11_NODE_93_length_17080_cov_10.504093_10_plen_183_part_00
MVSPFVSRQRNIKNALGVKSCTPILSYLLVFSSRSKRAQCNSLAPQSKPIRLIAKPFNEFLLLGAWYILYLAVHASINEEEACMQGAYDARTLSNYSGDDFGPIDIADVQPESPWQTGVSSYISEDDVCDLWLPPATTQEYDSANRTKLYGNSGAVRMLTTPGTPAVYSCSQQMQYRCNSYT